MVGQRMLWMFVIVHIMWACGILPGTTGFAFANDVDDKIAQAVTPLHAQIRGIERTVESIRQEQRAARIAVLEVALFDVRRSQCTAIANRNAEAVAFYARKMDETKTEYHVATGREYQPPSCSEIGVE